MVASTLQRPHATLVLLTRDGREMSVAMDLVDAVAAGAALDFDSRILDQLRRYEIIAGDGELLNLEDAARVVDELRAAMAPVANNPILISEAAEKYGFTSDSIYNWISAGWVKVLIKEPRRHIDEGDLALAKALADRRGHIAGRAVFPPKPRSGRPKKHK